jgi:hypothetical protein
MQADTPSDDVAFSPLVSCQSALAKVVIFFMR